jgi:hypothetical protein
MTNPNVLPTSGDKTLDAEMRASQWLAHANDLAECGRVGASEKAYVKCQYWLDRYNKLAGNA